MSLRLRIDHGQDAGKRWRLSKEGHYTVGRLPSATLQVLDMKVSKAQCRITLTGSGDGAKAVIQDLESTHGTLVNGQPIATRTPLKPGDEIRVGLSILRVLSDGEADADVEPESSEGGGAEIRVEDKAAGTIAKPRRQFPPDELVGQEVGGYKVLQKIGQGGMGSVYVAEQLSLNREVAFKVLNEKLTSDHAFVDQFVNEARSAAALNHPNVVQVYDVGRENGRYYFSMEYVPGGSLEERLSEGGAADWREGLNWLMDAANALIFAQKRDILHRDVKPDNLMLAEDGSAKLCDLGLAKKAANPDMLAAGIIGTPAFISPEAIRRRKDIDVRSDLYSLGCTFYRVLTGENAFPAKTVKEILVGHLKSPVPHVTAKRPDVPREIDDAIHRLMQKEPEDRFQAPQDLLQALDKIRTQHGLEKHGLSPKSRKPLIIATAVFILLGVAAVVYALTRETKEVERPKTAAEIRAERERERLLTQQKFEIFHKDAVAGLATHELEEAKGALRFNDNWAKPMWAKLVADYREFADGLTSDENYGERPEIVEIAKKARGHAAKIEDYVENRRATDKYVKNARKTAVEDIDQGLQALARKHDAALAKRKWVPAALAALPAPIQALVKPHLVKKVKDILPSEVPAEMRAKFEDDPVLVHEKHVKPLVDKYFPGTPPGQKRIDRILELVRGAHKEAVDAAQAESAKKTHEGLSRAIDRLQDYLETLDLEPDPKAGVVAKELAKLRKEAEGLLATAERSDTALLVDDMWHDQAAYPELLKKLWAPKGLLHEFRLDDALREAERAASTMRYSGYANLTAERVEDVRALMHLLGRLVSTHTTGWDNDRATVLDEDGKEDSVKIREVRADGIKLGNDQRTWAQLGADWLLHRLLFDSKGEPRFAFAGDDHRGLAVLAEMAGDYSLANRHYGALQTQLDVEQARTLKTIAGRLARSADERAVAEAWLLAQKNLAEIRRICDEHDPARVGEDDFWEKDTHRKALREQKARLMELFQQAWDAMTVLQDRKFANTVWGTVLRKERIPGIRYAGEPVVAMPPRDDKAPGDAEKEPDAPKEPGVPPNPPVDAPKKPADEPK